MAIKEPVLLIDRGDMPSLAATVIQPDPARLVFWYQRDEGEMASRRLAMVNEHAEMLGVTNVIVSDGWDSGVALSRETPGLRRSLTLLQAAIVACESGCSKIIWPVQVGPDPARVSQAADCATTVGHLAQIGWETSSEARPDAELVIELPLVDLDEKQVLDLVDDCGAPLAAFWPCDVKENEPCGKCDGCNQWQRAFHARGLPWPWAGMIA